MPKFKNLKAIVIFECPGFQILGLGLVSSCMLFTYDPWLLLHPSSIFFKQVPGNLSLPVASPTITPL